jgi:hypothetical protein
MVRGIEVTPHAYLVRALIALSLSLKKEKCYAGNGADAWMDSAQHKC